MSQFTPPPPPPPPYQIPPTEPGLLGLPARATKWPTVVGVIAIVLGVFGTVCNVCPTVLPILQGKLEAALPAGSIQDAKIEERWIPWVIGSGGIAMLIGILQIVCGIGLMRRAPWSPQAMRTWAILAIVAGAASTVLHFQMETGKHRVVVIATSGPGTTMPATMPAGFERAALTIGMCMGLGYVCAFPIFVLIWLGREPIRDEIRTWATS